MTPQEELKEYHRQMQDNRRSVGDYEKAIKQLNTKDMNWRKFSSFLLGLLFIVTLIALYYAYFKPITI